MKLFIILLLAPLFTFAQFKPDSIWYDTKGDTLNVHGGGILYDHGTYYWFGEKRGKGASEGVTVYSSANLYKWKYEGMALSTVEGSDIEYGCLMERPKVIYNKKTKQYVMWFHLELKGKGYAAARAAVAVSKKVTGPYKYLQSFRPNGNMSRDMNLFVDDDGTAYHIYSSHENWDMRIARLSDDYLTSTTQDSLLFSKQREAPAIFKYQHKYYLITSGCTGWAPNKASVHVADNPFGPWKLMGNPMTGPHADITFYGQSTFILPVHGKRDAFIYIGDKWDPKNLKNSRYQWLPVTFRNDSVEIAWKDKWDLSVFK
jgi:beta-galactosidase